MVDYFNDPIGGDAEQLGQRIYHAALAGRRGFRPDQLGIPEEDAVWVDIFRAIGLEAKDETP